MSAVPPDLTILMPVYNEEGRVREAIERTLGAEYPFTYELLVVDDGSTDGTPAILAEYESQPSVRVLRLSPNRGKGAALRAGVQEARGRYTGVLDADLEYQADDLVPLLRPLLEGKANAAFGVRGFRGHTSHSYLYVLGNRFVTEVANVLFNVYLEDLMTGYKVVRTDIFQSLPLREPGFAIEPEIAARLLQRGERIYEVPVEYVARRHDEGKKLTSLDGLRVLRTLLRCRLGR
ncbi:MAG TPA: glycosyltransferase family 2 protein [Solirubrobacteraceae bacterium]|nr:glycosyltransferase family 2 protein [Solirubrobacteraceae bacterium]